MMIDVPVVAVVEKQRKRRRGDRVEAMAATKYGTKYVNDDGTYDIKFDGERKRGVKDSEIKAKGDSDESDNDRRSSRGSSRKTKNVVVVIV